MLNLEQTAKSLTLIASHVLNKHIEIEVGIDQFNRLYAQSKDIANLLGVPMFESLRIALSNNVKHNEDLDKYWFSMNYRYNHFGGGSNGCECFSAHINPDGSIDHISLPGNRQSLYPNEPYFKKLMTTKEMVSEFFGFFDNSYALLEDEENGLDAFLKDNPYFYLDSQNSAGDTILSHLARKGYTSLIKRMVESGANINSRTMNEETPIYHALVRGDKEIINYFIDQGAELKNISGKKEDALDIVKRVLARPDVKEETIKLYSEIGSIIEDKLLKAQITTSEDQERSMGF